MNKIRLPSNEIILYLLSIGGALTFAYSFLYFDAQSTGVMWWLLFARGIVLGGAAGLGMAKISNALPRVAKTFRPYGWGAFIGFLVVTPFIIAPVAYTSMNPSITELIPSWLRWLVAIAIGLFVDTVTAGVALTSGKLEPEQKPVQEQAEPKPVKPAPAEKKPAILFDCPLCSKSFASQAALNAHKRAHKPEKEN